MASDLVPHAEPVEQPLAKQMDLPDWLGRASQPSLSTFDKSTDAGMRLLSRIKIETDNLVSSQVGTEIDIVSWFMAPYDKVDAKTGEILPLVYVAMVLADGTTLGCSSIGIRRSLLDFTQQFGFKPWDPPVRCKIRSIKAAVGQMLALEYIGRTPPKASTNTKGK